jgi:quercetin dioxygenase-like cupin family protein
MHNSDGTALPLAKQGVFAADLINFPRGGGIATHSHPGAHILLVLRGCGILTLNGLECPLEPGDVYLVRAGVQHSIRVPDGEDGEGIPQSGLTLLSVANDHVPADSPKRSEFIREQ